MNRCVILASFGVSFGILPWVASAQEVETFDSPYSLTNRYGAWSHPGSSLTSHPTYFETAATDYGSGYKEIYPSIVDISASNTLQLDVTVNSGVAGFLVDLDDGEGDEWQWLFGYGLIPGGGIGGGNEYILQQPFSTPYTVEQGAGTFDFSQITGYNIELDPGSPTQAYDVNWNDLSGVNLVSALTWDNTGGTGDGATWDIATNQNWNSNPAPASYADGANVTFNDTNNGHYNVTLNTTVSPASVTVDNSTGNYTISGTGSIAGTAGLTVNGGGSVTLATSNTFTGNTLVTSGTLTLAHTAALGGSTLDTSGTGAVSFGGLAAASLGGLTGSGNLALANTAAGAVALA
ncbi:MAG TPA: hypothetical protein VGG44_00810, partial [Tepidisphaeraceae bacterium]